MSKWQFGLIVEVDDTQLDAAKRQIPENPADWEFDDLMTAFNFSLLNGETSEIVECRQIEGSLEA